jgi:hypothetical protein
MCTIDYRATSFDHAVKRISLVRDLVYSTINNNVWELFRLG